MNRRKFITANMMAMSSIAFAQSPSTEISKRPDSKVKFFCPRWGASDSWDSFCGRVKNAGYDGIEAAVSSPQISESAELLGALQKHGLLLIGQYYQSFEPDPGEHAANYEKYLRALAALKPLFINSQTGKDYFTVEQNLKLFQIASTVAKETGITIVHETHRGKALFAAHVSKQYLDRAPEIRLTLDISHWCNVHESLLQDQASVVDYALSRTNHIHSRVGHQEGPQVNDPRADEWKDVVLAHLHWWDKVVSNNNRSGRDTTVTTEFGPPTYMPVLPYTQQPVASQWDINVHMLNLLKKRYA
jgi:sugar phosphate isomerase/epimerase